MEQKEMRAVFADTLRKLMREDEKIMLVDADLARANGTIQLREEFPDRALDVGIAEQNMASIAAGMAAMGATVVIGSFTPFASRKICDQIAISICYAGQNVKIVGTDPGLAAELNGGTHMSVEDLGVLRSIPGIRLFEPIDCVQLEQALPEMIRCEDPVYIRMFRKKIPSVFHSGEYRFRMDKADVLREGRDVTLAASGLMVQESLKAVKLLEEKHIDVELIAVHTLKPLDEQTILDSVKKTGTVVTCENHSVIGGLGTAVSEVLAKHSPAPVQMIGIQDRFGQVGMMDFLKEEYGMNAEKIAQTVLHAVHSK